MLLYLIPIFIFFIGVLRCDVRRKTKYTLLLMLISFIYMTLLIGLRFEVGGDTLNYMGDYQWRVPLSDWEPTLQDNFQPGYVFLCALAKSISPEFYVFQLMHVFLLNLLIFIFIYRNAKYRFAALTTVYYICYIYFSTEILRESLSVMVFMFNYKNFEQEKWVKYYLGVALAALFHISAVFLLLLPFIKWVKFDKKYLYAMLLVMVGTIAMDKVFAILSNIALVGEKISSYSDMTSIGLFAGTINLMKRCIFPVACVLFFRHGCNKEMKYERAIAIMSLFGMASFFSPVIFGRVINYFIIFFAISFSDAVMEMFLSRTRVLIGNAKIFLICFILLYGSEYVLYRRYERFLPYYSIFNPVSVDRDNFN